MLSEVLFLGYTPAGLVNALTDALVTFWLKLREKCLE
jgi:hypothetical protein